MELYSAEDRVMAEINSILDLHEYNSVRERLRDYLGIDDESMLTRILDGDFSISSIYEALLDIPVSYTHLRAHET